jgi:hypothetical protein
LAELIVKSLLSLRRVIASDASGSIAWVLMLSLSAIYMVCFVIERGV